MTMATTKCDNDKFLLTRGDDIGNDMAMADRATTATMTMATTKCDNYC